VGSRECNALGEFEAVLFVASAYDPILLITRARVDEAT